MCTSVCVCVFVYECALDRFIVGKAEQMGPPYQRVQQNGVQPTVIQRDSMNIWGDCIYPSSFFKIFSIYVHVT